MTAKQKADIHQLTLLNNKEQRGSSTLTLRAEAGTAQVKQLGQPPNPPRCNSGVPPLGLQVWR